MDSCIEIIKVFYKDLDREYTIRQVAKHLKKSYSYTNTHCRELISNGILSKKIVGASILCRLNYTNDNTIGLLVLASIQEKTQVLEKNKKLREDASVVVEQIIGQIKELSDTIFSIFSIFFAQNKFHIVCRNELECSQKLSAAKLQHGFHIYDKHSLKAYLKQHGLKDAVVIYGFENFWRVVGND